MMQNLEDIGTEIPCVKNHLLMTRRCNLLNEAIMVGPV